MADHPRPSSTETVLITGGSSGIGRALAELFAADGSDLVLVARRRHLLEEAAADLRRRFGIGVTVVPIDLSEVHAPEVLFHAVESEGRVVDVLVNNAGFGARGRFAELDTRRQMELIQVNIAALTHLTRLFLPAMLERGRGGVINTGSMAGFLPGPRMAVYYASKAYVLALSEGLAEEVRGSGVQVTCIAPGPTETEFLTVAGTRDARHARAGTADVRDIAQAGHRGFRAGRVVVIPEAKMKLGAFLLRFGPRPLVRRIAAYINE